MRTFGSNNKFSRGPRKPRFGSRDRGQSTMYTAVCGDCGKDCQVPFMPTQERPVYCSDCFEKRGNGKKGAEGGKNYRDSRDARDNRFGRDDRGDDRNTRRSNFSNNSNFSGSNNRSQDNCNQELLESIDLKLNKILRIIDSK